MPPRTVELLKKKTSVLMALDAAVLRNTLCSGMQGTISVFIGYSLVLLIKLTIDSYPT